METDTYRGKSIIASMSVKIGRQTEFSTLVESAVKRPRSYKTNFDDYLQVRL